MSTQVIQAPFHPWREKTSVFLAGSIDMGTAINWQPKVIDAIEDRCNCNVTIYNPRRDDWDSSWKQTLHDRKFAEQVRWELQKMDEAKHIFMYISAESKAPISLLEFGRIHAKYPGKLIICVEPGFYRRGNIEVMCQNSAITLHNDLEAAIDHLLAVIPQW